MSTVSKNNVTRKKLNDSWNVMDTYDLGPFGHYILMDIEMMDDFF